jgi:hypothetical protein
LGSQASLAGETFLYRLRFKWIHVFETKKYIMPTHSPKKTRFFLLFFLVFVTAGFLIFDDVLSGPREIVVLPGAVPGDINGDGKTNLADFRLLSDSLGKSAGDGGYNEHADLNGDDRVDLSDFHILRRNYGRTGATHTAVLQSTATPTLTPSPSPTASPQPRVTGEMWISQSELMSLPTSGPAWDKLSETAYQNWGEANLRNQDSDHAIYTLAGALVYARTGDEALRMKVRDGIIEAKQSLDEPSEWQARNGVLAAGRQLGAYVISADLINLAEMDPAVEEEFRSWLRMIRTQDIGTHGRWKSITYTCENTAANWGTFACASRIAASVYLDDTADVRRTADILRAWMGERRYYPADAPGENGYFQQTSDYRVSWSCNESAWIGVNPPCVKSDINLDGAIVEDASRGGECCILRGDGFSYSWEVLQGVYVSAELLYRAGNFGNPYEWSDQALRRALDFMLRSDWKITTPATYVSWMANARYGTSYPEEAVFGGRIMGWGDWLYQR